MPPIRTNNDTPLSDDGTYFITSLHREFKHSRFGKPYSSSSRAITATHPTRTHSGRGSNSHETSPTVFSEPSTASASSKRKTDKSRTAKPVIVSGIPLRPTVAFDTFWIFAAERKAIDDRRRTGDPAPWTEDSILQKYFFCNTYRVLDKVCQYLIKEVIEKGSQDPEEVVFRVLLFNTFTKIETWELLDRKLGPLTWASYEREKYRKVLGKAFSQAISLYTRAFIKPAPHFGFKANHDNHLAFLEMLMENDLASRLLVAPYLANVYEYLISFPSMGPFSTYQLMLCLSYTNVVNFHHNDFVIAGPGSISGLNKIFGSGMAKGRQAVRGFDEDVMRYLAENQDFHFKRLGLEFSGFGPKRLPMGVADIEHTLCEVDKYCRVAHPQLKGKRTNLHRTFQLSKSSKRAPAVVPKAWSHPARKVPRIRPKKTLDVQKRYEIECLRDHRDGPKEREYLVYWLGYPPSEATWESEDSLLEDAKGAVMDYLASLKSKSSSVKDKTKAKKRG